MENKNIKKIIFAVSIAILLLYLPLLYFSIYPILSEYITLTEKSREFLLRYDFADPEITYLYNGSCVFFCKTLIGAFVIFAEGILIIVDFIMLYKHNTLFKKRTFDFFMLMLVFLSAFLIVIFFHGLGFAFDYWVN
jgi:hypothetical protein